MGRSIAVVSGKGGVGKTTIVCGLGMAFAKKGFSVCVIDFDVGLNNLDVLLGMENRIVYDYADFLNGKCRLSQAIVRHHSMENLYVLVSNENINFDNHKEKTIKTLEKLSNIFDYVLVDSPAGVGAGFKWAVDSCGECIVVVSPHITSIRDAGSVLRVLKGGEQNILGVVVNRARGDLVVRKKMLSHVQISQLLNTELLGVVPESDIVNIYTSFQFDKIISCSGALEPFYILVDNIRYERKNIYDYESKYKGVLGVIRRNIRKGV